MRCPSAAYTAINVSLFLYNAAVWNAHRIHYDEAYTTGVDHCAADRFAGGTVRARRRRWSSAQTPTRVTGRQTNISSSLPDSDASSPPLRRASLRRSPPLRLWPGWV